MKKEEIKQLFTDNFAIVVQIFIQVVLFFIVASAIVWNEDATLKEALAFISIFTIANIMTFNNGSGYGGTLYEKTQTYQDSYVEFKKIVNSILTSKTDSTIYLPEFIEEYDKAQFEAEVKNELRPIFMPYERWEEKQYAKMSNKELKKLNSDDVGDADRLTKKEIKTLISINKIKSYHTDIKNLMSEIKTDAKRKGLSKEAKVAITNTTRIIRFILVSCLYTYIVFNLEEVDRNTWSNYFIKSMPIILAFISGIKFGIKLKQNKIAEYNDDRCLLVRFVEWLGRKDKENAPKLEKEIEDKTLTQST